MKLLLVATLFIIGGCASMPRPTPPGYVPVVYL